MPTFPSIPLSEVSPISINDPWLQSTHAKYLYQARTRNIRPKRAYEVEWKGLPADQKNIIERFIRSQRGPVVSFQWTHPFRQTIIMASNTDPITIETAFDHNVLDLDTVIINGVLGNTAANGTHQAKVINATTFELIHKVGNGEYIDGGGVRIFFPYMGLVIDNDGYKGSEKMIGRDIDNLGYYNVRCRIIERYY